MVELTSVTIRLIRMTIINVIISMCPDPCVGDSKPPRTGPSILLNTGMKVVTTTWPIYAAKPVMITPTIKCVLRPRGHCS